MKKAISWGDEIRRMSDREMAEFIVTLHPNGACNWCIYKGDCHSSTDAKCVEGVEAFLGMIIRYEE